MVDGVISGEHEALWTAVDRYICDRIIPQDPVLDAALAASAAAGLAPIASSATQGKLLELIVRVHGAKRSLSWARWAATARSGSRGAFPRTVSW